jgi:hypothetical protein
MNLYFYCYQKPDNATYIGLIVQFTAMLVIQGDQKVSVHLMITVQKIRKNILNSFNHLP